MVSGTSDRALCPMTGCCHFANVTFNGHIEPQNNGPLYNNEVIGTLTVDGWAVTLFWYSEEGPERAAAPPSPLLAVPNVTVHPSTASVPTSYYSMWHYNCLCTIKGQWHDPIVIVHPRSKFNDKP